MHTQTMTPTAALTGIKSCVKAISKGVTGIHKPLACLILGVHNLNGEPDQDAAIADLNKATRSMVVATAPWLAPQAIAFILTCLDGLACTDEGELEYADGCDTATLNEHADLAGGSKWWVKIAVEEKPKAIKPPATITAILAAPIARLNKLVTGDKKNMAKGDTKKAAKELATALNMIASGMVSPADIIALGAPSAPVDAPIVPESADIELSVVNG